MNKVLRLMVDAVEDGTWDATGCPSVLIPGDAVAKLSIAALEDYFGDETSCDQVGLVYEGQPIGVLTRAGGVRLVDSVRNHLGGSGTAALPGRSGARFVTMCCPVDRMEFLVVASGIYDDLECPTHPGTMLEMP